MSTRFTAPDESLHASDPDDWSWNESWFLSWIDLDGEPAGFFRVGVLPNQGRAMLWGFVHVDRAWLGVEESRLDLDHFDLTEGVAYDRWALQFAWRPDPPLEGAHFAMTGTLLSRTPTRRRRLTRPTASSSRSRHRGPSSSTAHATIGYDDAGRTIASGSLGFVDPDGQRLEVWIVPVAPSVAFDMTHTCQEPEHWLDWRTLVEARVSGWDAPCRGWLEASRDGAA